MKEYTVMTSSGFTKCLRRLLIRRLLLLLRLLLRLTLRRLRLRRLLFLLILRLLLLRLLDTPVEISPIRASNACLINLFIDTKKSLASCVIQNTPNTKHIQFRHAFKTKSLDHLSKTPSLEGAQFLKKGLV